MDLLKVLITGLITICLVHGIEHRLKKVASPYKYDTAYFGQPVDHFGFENKDTFQMRYLINKDNWNSNGGPILFYCGNEGDIETFAANTGFMWGISAELKAMVIFAEHRYYGKSMPYGEDSFKDAAHLGYLSSEQALADYAVFLQSFKLSTDGAANSPVVAFGGSYGGMLAAWMRAKYPQAVVGALAASAPVWQFQNITPCESYDKIVTNTFARYGDNCVENIRQSWAAIDNMFKTGPGGQDYLKSTFNVCGNLTTQAAADGLKAWLTGAWSNIAMVEYPYPANFLQNLPAWPVKGVCKQLSQKYWTIPKIHLRQVAQAAQQYFNYSGSYAGKCFNTTAEPDNLGADLGWGFQACSEMVMPMCSDNKQDFFEASSWNLDTYVKSCSSQYTITPRPWWIMTNYLGRNLRGVTNIIFSNGLLDPWHGGGVLKSIPEQNITALTIPNGAHHLDLRATTDLDPVDVISARAVELEIITQWINDAKN